MDHDESTANIPIIAVNAHAIKSHVAQGKQSQFNEYLIKPIIVKTNLDAIEKFG